MTAQSAEDQAAGEAAWTVDELAAESGLPVRTIREYQTIGLLPPPRKRGRVGVYGAAHLSRVQLIGRLQDRGYSLRGIRDLLQSWRNGADLGDVLGLAPDQLVHVDEPGVPTELHRLEQLLPGLLPTRLHDLLAVGALDECRPGRYCVPSPSLLQLAADALAAGLDADRVVSLLRTINQATAQIADGVLMALDALPETADPEQVAALATRGRGLLGHATGRMTIYALGRRLSVRGADESDGLLVTHLVRAGK